MRSLISDNQVCVVCGTTYWLERHHVYGASNRNKSEEDGAWCYLCHNHHTGSRHSVHMDAEMAWKLKEYTQRKWMERYGKTEEDFRKRYGRSYLQDTDETAEP